MIENVETRGFRWLAGKPTITKDPDDELDYAIGYSGRLPASDMVASVIAVADGVTVVRTEISGDGKYVTVWVKGGTAGRQASVSIRAVTAGVGSFPRTIDTTLYFTVR